jgi:UDP-2,4-diacetamido-2,4,6-trideoxy-beta-L-altropyranose hydrolase
MSLGTLIIRADASATIGLGHVMRCLALAQAWQDRGGKCVFAVSQPPRAIADRLKAQQCEVFEVQATASSPEDAGQVADLATQNASQWVVMDGYHFGIEYQQVLKSAGLKLLVVDDYGQIGAYAADIVLDQNAGAADVFYQNRAPDTHLLLGTRYAMLRREFKTWRDWKREIPPVARKILVTMGGSDPENLTAQVIEALESFRGHDLDIVVIAGSGNANLEALQATITGSNPKLRLEVDAASMPDLIAWADVAISSAGSTCWEMCLLGLPAIVTDAARNQRELARELDLRKIAVLIPHRGFTPRTIAVKLNELIADSELRRHMTARGRALVDGRGSERVVAAMRAHTFALRKVTPGDRRLLWEWANDPQVRQASFSSAQIPWEEHSHWFDHKVHDDHCHWLIFSSEETPAAVIRIEMNSGTDAEIGITVGPQFRSQGLAPNFLERAVQHAWETSPLLRLHARIKPGNRASLAAFKHAGFELVGTTTVRHEDALHYVRERANCTRSLSADQQLLTVEAV